MYGFEMKLKFLVLVIMMAVVSETFGRVLRGHVREEGSGIPVAGATLVVVGTSRYAMTDENGYYEISLGDITDGVISLSCLSYKPVMSEPVSFSSVENMDFVMVPDVFMIEGVVVTERKNEELESVLFNERKTSVKAVENIGAQEMSAKGLSNAAEAVVTMTGVSFADAGELFVRGLGDRYSLTTLNGIPIASPNPDNKLIPLDVFPSSTISSLTVSKVYEASSFADYSGARIDIGTKQGRSKDFFSVSLKTTGNDNTTFRNFHKADRKGMLLVDNNLPSVVDGYDGTAFSEYMKDNDPFATSFSVGSCTALPGIGGSVSGGKSFETSVGTFSFLAAASMDTDSKTINDAETSKINAQGTYLSHFDYDSYARDMSLSALFNAGYMSERGDDIGYALLYSKNVIDDYKLRVGYDAEGNSLTGSNVVTRSYSLLSNQLYGVHDLGSDWSMDWKVSYGMTESNEPDRRQVMYRNNPDGTYSFFKLNSQGTMRYFGELCENEIIGDVKAEKKFGDANLLRFGIAVKDKSRNYESTKFYYKYMDFDPVIEDIFNAGDFINGENISSGLITVSKDAQPKDRYFASQGVYAGFVEGEYYPVEPFMVSLGVRYEYSEQNVRYWDDGGREKVSSLPSSDFFPALNMKYDFGKGHFMRFAASYTVTRPLFVEMAPFLYKESYGSAETRGDENLRNGYNYNFDLKYEFFGDGNRTMFSAGVYYKILKSPIEMIQRSSGGAIIYSFRNAEQGMAAGFEAEFRTQFAKFFQVGANVSLMYTDVTLLANGGIYTDSRRALQGASPYLGNAFVTYSPVFRDKSRLSASILYNLQGPRIHTVGVYGLGNEMQDAFHSLDMNVQYSFRNGFGIGMSVSNLLDQEVRFTQEVKTTGETVVTESYRFGRSFTLELKYNF